MKKLVVIILVLLSSIFFSQVVRAQSVKLWSLEDSIRILQQKDSILEIQVLSLKKEIILKKEFLSKTKSFKEAEDLKVEISMLKDSVEKVTPHYSRELKALKKAWEKAYMGSQLWEYNGFGLDGLICPEDQNKVFFLIEEIQRNENIDPELKKEILYNVSFLLYGGMSRFVVYVSNDFKNLFSCDPLLAIIFSPEVLLIESPLIVGSVLGSPSAIQKKYHAGNIYDLTGLKIKLKDLPKKKEAVKYINEKQDLRSIKDFKKFLRN